MSKASWAVYVFRSGFYGIPVYGAYNCRNTELVYPDIPNVDKSSLNTRLLKMAWRVRNVSGSIEKQALGPFEGNSRREKLQNIAVFATTRQRIANRVCALSRNEK